MRRGGLSRPNLALDLLVACLLALTVVALIGTHPSDVPLFDSIWPVLGFIPLFYVGEAVQIRLEVRRQAYSFSVSEAPLIVSLFFLSPVAILLVRLVGATVVQIHRKLSPRKIAVNLAVVGAETAAAAYIFDALGHRDPEQTASWLAAYAAIGVAAVLGVAAVSAAITIVQGAPSSRDMIRSSASILLTSLLNGAVGLLVLIVISVNAMATVLLALVAGMLIAGYRAYTGFLQQHKNLGELYEFTKAVEHLPPGRQPCR